MTTPQDKGRRFEKFWSKLFGVKPHKGSGNLWFLKLDVNDSVILWSCKWTEKESLRVTRDMMREVQDAITGQGGIGGEIIPGIATGFDSGEAFVTLRAEDFLWLASSGRIQYVQPTKAQQKRKRASVPGLLRDD